MGHVLFEALVERSSRTADVDLLALVARQLVYAVLDETMVVTQLAVLHAALVGLGFVFQCVSKCE